MERREVLGNLIYEIFFDVSIDDQKQKSSFWFEYFCYNNNNNNSLCLS
jgi:hypothetical protein